MNEEAAAKIDGFLYLILRDSGLSLTHHLEHNPPGGLPELSVEFRGLDSPRLLEHNAELLLSLEHLATQILRLAPEQHDLVSFDVDGFKAGRYDAIEKSAQDAIHLVRLSGEPFAFPPMSSRERRLLHLALNGSGLRSMSIGEGGGRHLVLYPRAVTSDGRVLMGVGGTGRSE